MDYQYQVDRGNGYENVYPDYYGVTPDQTEDTDAWFASVEAEGVAERARILFGGSEVEERIFD